MDQLDEIEQIKDDMRGAFSSKRVEPQMTAPERIKREKKNKIKRTGFRTGGIRFFPTLHSVGVDAKNPIWRSQVLKEIIWSGCVRTRLTGAPARLLIVFPHLLIVMRLESIDMLGPYLPLFFLLFSRIVMKFF